MRVTRCVCRNLTFEQLKPVADECGGDFDALCQRTGCCQGCGSCEPYVRLMIETGQTRFPVLRRFQIDEIMARSRGEAVAQGQGNVLALRSPESGDSTR